MNNESLINSYFLISLNCRWISLPLSLWL